MSLATRVALSTSYFFLVMTAYYILKPVRESFFLQEQGYGRLPGAHLLVMGVTFLAVQVYVAAARRLSRAGLVGIANGVFVGCVLGFWVLLVPAGIGPETRSGLAWIYYCWVSLFSVFAVTLFWSLAHSLFSSEEGSAWYGVIGAGGILGAMTGGALTRSLAETAGTENLLLVSAALLVPCAFVGLRLARGGGGAEDAEDDPGSPAPRPRRSARELFRESPYLSGIAALVLLSLLVAVLDDYRFKQVIQSAFEGETDARTAFLGSVYAATNLIGLSVSLLVTGPVQARFGALPGLLTYPSLVAAGGLFMGLVGVDLDGVFWLIALQQGFAYSIYQASRELLYLPTSAEVKFVAKGFVDTFVFRVGTGTGALLLILVGFPDPVRQISWITVPAASLLLLLAVALGREFPRRRDAARAAAGSGSASGPGDRGPGSETTRSAPGDGTRAPGAASSGTPGEEPLGPVEASLESA